MNPRIHLSPAGPAPEDPPTPTGDGHDDPSHAGVTDDALEQAAAAAFGSAGSADGSSETPNDGGDAAGEAGEAAGAPEGEAPAAPAAGDDTPSSDATVDWSWDLGDGNTISLSRNEALEWARFGSYLRQNPQVAAAVAAVLQGDAPESPGTEPQASPESASTSQTGAGQIGQTGALTPPEGLDLDDPQIAALWDLYARQHATMQELNARVEGSEHYVQEQQQTTVNAMLARARQSFQEARALTNEQMQTVYDVAGRLGVLPSLMSPVDPVTGQPRQVDPLAAMEQAFDLALWSLPEIRTAAMQEEVRTQQQDRTRKAKLSSLSGSSGSTPRTAPDPRKMNAGERREAMIQEVAGMIQGEGA